MVYRSGVTLQQEEGVDWNTPSFISTNILNPHVDEDGTLISVERMLLCDVAIAGLRVLVDHARQGATNLLKVLITWEEEAANDPTGATSNSTNDNRLAIVESYGKGDPVAIATPIVSTFVIAGRV